MFVAALVLPRRTAPHRAASVSTPILPVAAPSRYRMCGGGDGGSGGDGGGGGGGDDGGGGDGGGGGGGGCAC